ncbi:MAG: hypothetical protein ACPG80_00085 [Rickettsiales bacterium]
MSGKWVTKATGKTPPTDDFSGISKEMTTILVQGKNGFGDEVYSYINLPLENIQQVRDRLASGESFVPSHFGTVIAAGKGKPSQEVKDEVGKTEFMVYFEPKRLPNTSSDAAPRS